MPLSAVALLFPEKEPSPRLRYVMGWIFSERLGLSFHLCHDEEEWQVAEGFKINYSKTPSEGAQLWIKPQGLLSEQGEVTKKHLAIQRWKHTTVLFYNQPGAPVPFDIFSAVFYCISRYEEYLPYVPDKHGRFPSAASAAGEFRFLSDPVADQWLFHFKQVLTEQGVVITPRPFQWQVSFDVDMAWKYRHRGQMRYWGGMVRDLLHLNLKGIRERALVVAGRREDPYYSFSGLHRWHQKHGLRPLCFLLLGTPHRYDRNISGSHPAMQQLIAHLDKQYDLGIHPSYHSHEDLAVLKEEIGLLSTAVNRPVTRSRQHFIKFTLPETYRRLIQSGIQEDYSMGYPDRYGFRAGTSHSFLWYDLSREEATRLRIHPFAFMDATAHYYLRQSPEEALREWKKIFLKLQAVDGHFISIWHNYILSTGSEWHAIYEKALAFSGR